MKTYGQRCPAALALDVVGDRWSLLIVRELLIGPRRYRDLQDGLPGISTNVLATRLRELHDAGIVIRHELAPPTVVAVYELTDAGRALGPTLAALRSWGAHYGPAPRAEDALRPAWVLIGATARPSCLTPGKVGELRVDSLPYRLTSESGRLVVGAGMPERPDVIVGLGAEVLYRLSAGRTTPSAARRQCTIEGDEAFALEILNALHATTVPSVRARPSG